MPSNQQPLASDALSSNMTWIDSNAALLGLDQGRDVPANDVEPVLIATADFPTRKGFVGAALKSFC
jgi:hypothetical protein